MDYSIEDVAKLAKVSVRTLHYYDEIDLLKPLMRVSNGRRLYDVEGVLRLFDILFYKKMGFNLKKIKSVLKLSNKDKKSLVLLKKELIWKEIERLKEMLKTIDITLDYYYKGEDLNYDQIISQFENFQSNTKTDKEKFYQKFGRLKGKEKMQLKNLADQSKEIQEKLQKIDMEKYNKKSAVWIKKIMKAIDDNEKEGSVKVQKLMKEYYGILNSIQLEPITKEKWLNFGMTLREDKNCYLQYAKLHTDLPKFLFKAIKIYAKNLK